MKKVFYLITLFLIVSCTDSETILEVTESDILGTWNLTTIYGQTNTKVIYDSFSQTATTSIIGNDISIALTFTEIPKEFEVNGNLTISTETTSILGTETYEYETNSVNDLEYGEWELVGDYIVFMANNQELKYKIDSLDDTEMILKQTIDDVTTSNDTTIEISGEATMKFER